MRRIKQLKIIGFFLFLLTICLFSLFPFSSQAFATTIVLDPGHSAVTKGVYDDPYNIYDEDYPNTPEITEVFDVAKWLQGKLQADGYTVILTKDSANSPSFVSLYQRAQIANNAHADLAVSIHDDHTQSWGSFAQVYVQKTDEYRVDKNGKKVTFADTAGSGASAIATKSQQYGQMMASARTAAEGHTATVTDANFAGRAPLATGNIPQVQLYAKVPWIYNEVGGIGLTQADIGKYEQGILNGIEKAVPSQGAQGGGTLTATSNCVITAVGNNPGSAVPPECQTNQSESAVVQKVIALAKAHLKTGTYVWGSPPRDWASDKSTGPNSPAHFDCSGFVGWAWYWGSGGKISMAGQTNADWDNPTNPHYDRVATKDETQLQPGDIIYFNFGADPPDHVGLFVGKDPGSSCKASDCFVQYYQSGLPGNEVSLSTVKQYFMGYIRIKGI